MIHSLIVFFYIALCLLRLMDNDHDVLFLSFGNM